MNYNAINKQANINSKSKLYWIAKPVPCPKGGGYFVRNDGICFALFRHGGFMALNDQNTPSYFFYKNSFLEKWKDAKVGKLYTFNYGPDPYIRSIDILDDLDLGLPIFLGFKEICAECGQLSYIECKDNILSCINCKFIHGIELSEDYD